MKGDTGLHPGLTNSYKNCVILSFFFFILYIGPQAGLSEIYIGKHNLWYQTAIHFE